MRPKRPSCWVLAALAAAAAGASAPALGAEGPPAGARIEQAIAGARAFLKSQIGKDGQVAGEFPPTDRRHLYGGRTGLCVYALLTAGADERDPTIRRAIRWLAAAKFDGTYAVAMRACALAAVRREPDLKALAADAEWLIRAAGRSGAYTYAPHDGAGTDTWDNCCTHIAALGVWEAAARGVPIPADYWRRLQQHWVDQQQFDGGWAYGPPRGTGRAASYGSMTAAGLATLYACFDRLEAEKFVRCTGTQEYQPISRGLDWVSRRFSAEQNPRKGVEWTYYWLFAVQRVGQASGYKYLGTHDWYAEGADELLSCQNADGSWGPGKAPLRLAPTALALLFLAGGRHPVIATKLEYSGKWNPRPRDLANLARWATDTLERPVSWQVVGRRASLEDWRDAPLLYLSGAGPCELTDAQVDRLRQFALRGGLIVSEAACASGTFTLDMRRLYARLFPDWPFQRLPDDHPIYALQFAPKGLEGLWGVSNGVRLLAVHSARDVSLGLQLGPRAPHAPSFYLMANLLLYATDREPLRPRGAARWPTAGEFEPRATLRVARVKHEGNCDPEPMAWPRLAALMARERRLRLSVSELTPVERLDANMWPIAAMTGTEAFRLTKAQAAALERYFEAGGTLVVDAAGGSEAFAAAVRKELFPLAGAGVDEPIPHRHPIYGNLRLGVIGYRRDYARALGDGAGVGRLRGVREGERYAIIFSPDDLTAGLVGGPVYRLRGYTPEAATALMASVLMNAAGVRAEEAKSP